VITALQIDEEKRDNARLFMFFYRLFPGDRKDREFARLKKYPPFSTSI